MVLASGSKGDLRGESGDGAGAGPGRAVETAVTSMTVGSGDRGGLAPAGNRLLFMPGEVAAAVADLGPPGPGARVVIPVSRTTTSEPLVTRPAVTRSSAGGLFLAAGFSAGLMDLGRDTRSAARAFSRPPSPPARPPPPPLKGGDAGDPRGFLLRAGGVAAWAPTGADCARLRGEKAPSAGKANPAAEFATAVALPDVAPNPSSAPRGTRLNAEGEGLNADGEGQNADGDALPTKSLPLPPRRRAAD